MTAFDNVPLRDSTPFIAVDGGDAVGKTTICEYIDGVLKSFGHDTVLSTGHAHGEFGSLVRSTILHPWTSEASHTSQLLLFLANRRHILEEVVWPALDQGIIPIVDRWHLTSRAYQYNAVNALDVMMKVVPQLPTLNFVLLAPKEVSEERRKLRNRATDHLEERAINDADNLNRRFREGAESDLYAAKTIIIDTSKPLTEVYDDVRMALMAHIGYRRKVSLNGNQ